MAERAMDMVAAAMATLAVEWVTLALVMASLAVAAAMLAGLAASPAVGHMPRLAAVADTVNRYLIGEDGWRRRQPSSFWIEVEFPFEIRCADPMPQKRDPG